jgi:predicted lipoprotein with Yx(FWY)xxD motif
VIRNRYLLAGALSAITVAVGAAASAGTGFAATHAPKSSSAVLKVATISITEGTKTVKKSGLVNSSGHPVYLLTGDSSKHPECTSQGCLGNWPAVTSSAKKPVLGKGVTGKVAVWHHNGINQLTLDGHPLYTYAADSSADKAMGEGLVSFGGTWKVIGASGSAVAMASSASGGSSGGGSGW